MNPKRRIETIDGALQELLTLEGRTKAPAPLPHQFVGTIVDNAIGLLTAPANALDGGHRTITFSDAQNWLSLMKGVHRYFFSSIHTAAELGLVTLCKERGITIRSRLRDATERPIIHIKQEAGHLPAVRCAIKDLRAVMRTNRPGFDDHLEAALSTVGLPKQTKKTWRRFFRALSIVRNKASHPDPTLTDAERTRLHEGGLEAMISATGELVVNPQMYVQVAKYVLDFFDLICNEANIIKPSAS